MRRGFKQVNKYGAKRTKVGETTYASKRESEYAGLLWEQKLAGKIAGWLEQVPVKLPGGVKYVCDFMVINLDGTVRFVEVKGVMTPAFKIKLRLLQDARPDVFERLEVVR